MPISHTTAIQLHAQRSGDANYFISVSYETPDSGYYHQSYGCPNLLYAYHFFDKLKECEPFNAHIVLYDAQHRIYRNY